MAVLDIGSWKPWPSGALSNFPPHAFVFEDVECASMEGLVQAFKFNEPYKQVITCKAVGEAAKNMGRRRNLHWQRVQTLWWKSDAYDRHSPEYQALLDRAYNALATNQDFRNALLATGDHFLTHSIGGRDPHETILTEAEFCTRLMRLRREIREGLR
ncbi:hypothetical protein DOMOVOI_04030 [Brevundimonas phage vB_BpoS-Domovoi]|uniref:Uncharacterized protein n=1 Tax=Brevundimonas phage vB_BpoS-Domovoi TaxID=2948598 RepID=A0A9E7SMI0_9CAUD|nr:hypothetical protein DOMOVOI_04030 [Brevundimonas phage vB_BpoS-Domovoi]